MGEIDNDVLKKFQPFIDLEKLPNDLRISTITMTCGFDTDFYLDNISRYIDLSVDSIDTVKYGDINDPNTNRTLVPIKKKTKRKGKQKRVFYNQATIIVKMKSGNRVNVKLFKNGSIQMTGCKSGYNCIEALTVLCREILKIKAVVDTKTLDNIIIKPFASNSENVNIKKVKNITIRMINSNFDVGFKINREKLYELLLSEKVECIYEPIVHACVNIKYIYNGKEKISIFVFESGSIIITGAKHYKQISEAYKFITKKIYENYNKIVINSLENLLQKYNIKTLMSKEDENSKNSNNDNNTSFVKEEDDKTVKCDDTLEVFI